MKPSRSIFAQRLNDYPEIVLRDEAAFVHRGGWRELFSERMPGAFGGRVVFEIGCFDASFLSRVAAKHPNVGFVGLDWKARALHSGALDVAKRHLKNLILIHGRGQDIASIFAPGELDEIWLFHPDPCDKPAEWKNRLFAEPFLLDAHSVLRDGPSALTLKTDHPGYYQWSLGLLGLPQPPWFAAARAAHLAGERLPEGLPRVRARDLMRDDQIPRANEAVNTRFDLALTSPDFWNDLAAQTAVVDRYFADEMTLFEQRFIQKRLPIYFLELRKQFKSRQLLKSSAINSATIFPLSATSDSPPPGVGGAAGDIKRLGQARIGDYLIRSKPCPVIAKAASAVLLRQSPVVRRNLLQKEKSMF